MGFYLLCLLSQLHALFHCFHQILLLPGRRHHPCNRPIKFFFHHPPSTSTRSISSSSPPCLPWFTLPFPPKSTTSCPFSAILNCDCETCHCQKPIEEQNYSNVC